MPFRFESLDIWHQARRFAGLVYQATAKFPGHEQYGLASQMNRAANSISPNIAEGAGRSTSTDFNRFLGIAVGSIFEVMAGSFLALDRGYVDQQSHDDLYREADSLARKINSFRQTLR